MREERQADTRFTVYSVHHFHHAEVSCGVKDVYSVFHHCMFGNESFIYVATWICDVLTWLCWLLRCRQCRGEQAESDSGDSTQLSADESRESGACHQP